MEKYSKRLKALESLLLYQMTSIASDIFYCLDVHTSTNNLIDETQPTNIMLFY
jgi:hypothetical protein